MLLWGILIGVFAWVVFTLLFLALVYSHGTDTDRRSRV